MQRCDICARSVGNLHASPLVKVTKDNKAMRKKEKDDVIRDADVAAYLADSKLPSEM